MRRALVFLVLVTATPSCSRPVASGDSGPSEPVPRTALASASPLGATLSDSGGASATKADADSPRGSASTPPLPETSTACPSVAGGPSCVRFARLENAFSWVLAHEPAILAIGEAHAQKGTENIPSATKRFTQSLLPLLQNRASDVLVEAWAGDPKCQREVLAVASSQAPIKAAQAQENPNEYLALGNRARVLGMVPDLLRPSCDDYASLADAGADVIPASLGLIKRLTQETATRLYRRNHGLANGKIVVTYGGAMHNDLFPTGDLRRYSFGSELAEVTGGRYVELDLIVPDYVKQTDTWERLPWYSAWQADAGSKAQTRLYRQSDSSFVLVFWRRRSRRRFRRRCARSRASNLGEELTGAAVRSSERAYWPRTAFSSARTQLMSCMHARTQASDSSRRRSPFRGRRSWATGNGAGPEPGITATRTKRKSPRMIPSDAHSC